MKTDLRGQGRVQGYRMQTGLTKRLEIEPRDAYVYTKLQTIDYLHYDVIRAKPDGNCSRPAETGPSFPGGKASG